MQRLLPRALRRHAVRAFALVAIVMAVVAGPATPAAAQGFGWFGGLFGGGGAAPPRQQRSYPAYPGYGGGSRPQAPSYGWGYSDGSSAADDYYRRPRPSRRRPSPPKETAETPAPAPAKTNATTFVGVFGDSLGQMLANGLDDALSDRPEVGVLHLAKGSTGLVSTGFYDWPKTIDDMLSAAAARKADKAPAADAKSTESKSTETKSAGSKSAKGKGSGEREAAPRIDVAVMMVGTNDRQPIVEDGKTLEFESDEWTAAYRKRVLAIDEAFAKRGIPLIWVGVPITRDSGFANDMAALNDIYREAAAKTGAVFVDTWEAFSDENGDFSAYGPDINGQTVRLRSADGIHFTRAGARKLAHFVEAHVRRALDGKVPPVELPTAAAPATPSAPTRAPAVAAARPEAGPIVNLNEPAKAAGGELAVIEPQHARLDANIETTLARGEAQPAPKGRADDFRWPKPSAASAAPAQSTAPAR